MSSWNWTRDICLSNEESYINIIEAIYLLHVPSFIMHVR